MTFGKHLSCRCHLNEDVPLHFVVQHHANDNFTKNTPLIRHLVYTKPHATHISTCYPVCAQLCLLPAETW